MFNLLSSKLSFPHVFSGIDDFIDLVGGQCLISANLNQSCNFTLIKISNIEQGIMNVEGEQNI